MQSIVICKCLCSSGTERSWRIAAHIEAFICFCAYAKDMPGNAHSGGGAGNADARDEDDADADADAHDDDDVDNDCDCALGLQ